MSNGWSWVPATVPNSASQHSVSFHPTRSEEVTAAVAFLVVGRTSVVLLEGVLQVGQWIADMAENGLAVRDMVVLFGLVQYVEVERGAVAHLVVVVVQAASQEHDDARAQIRHLLPELSQRAHRTCAHGGVLQNDAVVDVSDVLARVDCGGPLLTQQVRQARLLGVWDLADEDEDGFHYSLLVLKAALLAQDVGQKAERPDGLHHDDLELVRDIAHEVADLLEEAVHARLAARLEQGVGDSQRVRHGHLVESAHRREAEHRLGGGQEELQHSDRRIELARGDIGHVCDGPRRLKDHHLGLVPQAALEEVVEGPLLVTLRRARVGDDLGGVAHQQALCQRRAHGAARQRGDHLADGQAVVLADLVQQRQRVELHQRIARVHRLLDLVAPALDDVTAIPQQVQPRG
eukprot:scaffold950_cov340-Prasinococcus_capsulatus_cf.AAC.3